MAQLVARRLADPSSNPDSAHRGGFFSAMKQWRGASANGCKNVYCMYERKANKVKKSGIRPPNIFKKSK